MPEARGRRRGWNPHGDRRSKRSLVRACFGFGPGIPGLAGFQGSLPGSSACFQLQTRILTLRASQRPTGVEKTMRRSGNSRSPQHAIRRSNARLRSIPKLTQRSAAVSVRSPRHHQATVASVGIHSSAWAPPAPTPRRQKHASKMVATKPQRLAGGMSHRARMQRFARRGSCFTSSILVPPISSISLNRTSNMIFH